MTKEAAQDAPLLEIKDLCVSYHTRKGEVPAVVDFNLTLRAGEAVGLVGESGCGKSTVSLAIMRYTGGKGGIKSGFVKYRGRDMAAMSEEELRALRGSKIAMIYQEPFAALNPCLTIGQQLAEVPLWHDNATQAQARESCMRMLSDVRLPDPERIMAAYPHQLSGGQQQRAVIAMALLSKPDLLLLDEPTTALDVTVEAAIIEIVRELGRKTGTAMIYVSHNMGLILKTCERVCVMYSGQAVEEGRTAEIFRRARHPYTRGFSAASPTWRRTKTKTRSPTFAASCRSPPPARAAVISGRAAIFSSKSAAANLQSPPCPIRKPPTTACAASNGKRSTGMHIPPTSKRAPKPRSARRCCACRA